MCPYFRKILTNPPEGSRKELKQGNRQRANQPAKEGRVSSGGAAFCGPGFAAREAAEKSLLSASRIYDDRGIKGWSAGARSDKTGRRLKRR